MYNKEEYISPHIVFEVLLSGCIICQSSNVGIDDWHEDPDTPISF